MSTARTLAVIAAVDALLIALLIAFDADISPAKFLKNDALFRAAVDARSLEQLPYDDNSGLQMWLPNDHLIRRSVRSFELPVWNRRQGGGYSPVAHFYPSVFNPLRIVSAIFPERHAESALILMALGLGFAGMFVLLTERKLGRIAALFGAATFALCTHALAFSYLSGACVFGFLPWMLIAYFRLSNAPALESGALFAASVALLIISGHPLLVLASFIAFLLVAVGRRRALLPVSAGLLGGGLLALFAIQPFLIAVANAWSYKTRTELGVPLIPVSNEELALILKSFFIAPVRELGYDAPSFSAHVGLPVLALSVLGLVAHRSDPEARWLAPALAIALFLGLPGPWIRLASYVPILRFAKATYLYVAVDLFIAWTAALGVEVAMKRMRPGLLALALAAVALLPLSYMLPVLFPEANTFVPNSPALEFLRAEQKKQGPFRITATWGQTHLENIAALTELEDLRIAAPMLNARYHAFMETIDPEILGLNYPTMRRTNRLDSPLVGAFNVRFILEGKLPYNGYYTAITREELATFVPATVRPVIAKDAAVVYEDEAIRIFENRFDYRPRAFFSKEVRVVPAGVDFAKAALAEVVRSSSTALAADIVEVDDDELAGIVARIPTPLSSTISVAYPKDSEVVITTDAGEAGLLVLNDLYEDGWSATVDEEETPIFPVNLVARGILVPAGHRELHLSYLPPGLKDGMIVSGLAPVLFVLLLVRKKRRSAR